MRCKLPTIRCECDSLPVWVPVWEGRCLWIVCSLLGRGVCLPVGCVYSILRMLHVFISDCVCVGGGEGCVGVWPLLPLFVSRRRESSSILWVCLGVCV